MTTKSMFNPHLFMLKHQIPTVHHLSFVRQVVIANQVGTQLNGFPWRKGGVRMSNCEIGNSHWIQGNSRLSTLSVIVFS